jgi:hypothetical protein
MDDLRLMTDEQYDQLKIQAEQDLEKFGKEYDLVDEAGHHIALADLREAILWIMVYNYNNRHKDPVVFTIHQCAMAKYGTTDLCIYFVPTPEAYTPQQLGALDKLRSREEVKTHPQMRYNKVATDLIYDVARKVQVVTNIEELKRARKSQVLSSLD